MFNNYNWLKKLLLWIKVLYHNTFLKHIITMNEIILYSLIVFLIFFLNAKISYKLNLIDIPNKRKIHSKGTVFTGGIALSVALVFSIFLTDIFSHKLNLILSKHQLSLLIIDWHHSLNQ